MEFRVLGRTGIRVSALSVGTWQLAGPLTVDGRADGFPDVGRAQAVALIRACGDLGINAVDTAEIYGGGEGERRVGEALAGGRDRWVVTTKFGNRVDAAGRRVEDTRPAAIRASLEGSLRRLGTDHVDVYLYHSAPRPEGVLAARETLERLLQEGKLRAYGLSTDVPEPLELLLEHEAAQIVQLPRSMRRHPARLLAAARRRGLGVMVRGALASGLLSGRHAGVPPHFPPDDFRSHALPPLSEHAAFERLRPAGLSMAAFALRYVLDFDTTHTVVLGGRSLEHYTEAVSAVEARSLSTAEHALVDALRQALEMRRLARRRASGALRPLRRLLGRSPVTGD
jgi:aryl-alcohol dehydrogenase-like predicted oxidoreductase